MGRCALVSWFLYGFAGVLSVLRCVAVCCSAWVAAPLCLGFFMGVAVCCGVLWCFAGPMCHGLSMGWLRLVGSLKL